MKIFDRFTSKQGFVETNTSEKENVVMRFRKIHGGKKRSLETELVVYKEPDEGKYQCIFNRFDYGGAVVLSEDSEMRYSIDKAFEIFMEVSLMYIDKPLYANVYKAEHKIGKNIMKRYGACDKSQNTGFIYDILDVSEFKAFQDDIEVIIESVSKLLCKERCVVELNAGFLELNYENAEIVE